MNSFVKHEQLTLAIGGAFELSPSGIGLFVTNQPGFNYVIYHKGIYTSIGQLDPRVISWLKHTSTPTLELKRGFITERLKRIEPYKTKVSTQVYYGSIHHRDER